MLKSSGTEIMEIHSSMEDIDWNVLQNYLFNKRFKELKQLNTIYPDLFLKNSDDLGKSLLHIACDNGAIEAIPYVSTENTINHQDDCGWTPLHCACSLGHFMIVDSLLSLGADPLIPNQDGNYPLHYLVRQKLSKLTALNSPNGTTSNSSGTKPFLRIIQKMITLMKGQLNFQNRHGETPLHLAVRYGSPEVVQLLLHSRVLPDIPNNKGLTPLHIGVHLNQTEMVSLLVSAGADPLKTEIQGNTAFQLAKKSQNTQLALALIGSKEGSPPPQHQQQQQDNSNNSNNNHNNSNVSSKGIRKKILSGINDVIILSHKNHFFSESEKTMLCDEKTVCQLLELCGSHENETALHLIRSFEKINQLNLLVECSVKIGVSMAEKEGETTLFRENRLNVRILTQILYSKCEALLIALHSTTLSPSMSVLDPSNLEVHSSRVPSEEQRLKNIETMKHFTSVIIDWIFSTIDSFPPFVRFICKTIHQQVELVFKGVGHRTVSAMLFLNMFCPSIALYVQSDSTDSLTSAQWRRPLTYVTKTLQLLANGSLYDDQHDLSQLNELLKIKSVDLKKFVENIIIYQEDDSRNLTRAFSAPESGSLSSLNSDGISNNNSSDSIKVVQNLLKTHKSALKSK